MLYAEKSVLDFGARGDGRTNSHPAFQRALDAGEKYLYVPPGKYLIGGTLTIRSDTMLRLHSEAMLFWADGSGKRADSHLITNEKNAKNITIDGGIWDGNAEGNPQIPSPNDDEAYLGVTIEFRDMEGLRLQNMTIRNTEAFHLRLNYVRDFRAERITFDDQIIRPCQDGIHIAGGCENGIIRQIRSVGVSSPNDDMIAFISDLTGADLALKDPARGQRSGPIRNIVVEDIEADNTFSFLRIMSTEEPIENLSISHVRGGCYYLGIQMQISPYLRGTEMGKSMLGHGKIKNITISDWQIRHRHPYGMNVAWQALAEKAVSGLIDIEERAENLTIEHFVRETERDNYPALPTLHLNNGRTNWVELRGGEDTSLQIGGDSYTGGMILRQKTMPQEDLKLYGSIPYFHLG